MRRLAPALLVAALAAPAFAEEAKTVTIAGEKKRTAGLVKQAVPGDVACYLTMTGDDGAEFTELAQFEICDQKPSVVGRRVALTYKTSFVMSDECQGDPACRKKRKVALVTGARPLDGRARAAEAPKPAGGGQAHFCTAMEDTVFACRAGGKLVSVCASKDASPTAGYAQYRFGKPDSRDPLEMNLPEAWIPPAKAAAGGTLAFSGGGGAWMRFRNGPHAYVVFTGIGKWGPGGATREKAGVVVERGGKAIAHVACTNRPVSLLGPDWFARVGLEPRGQDFDLPD